MIPKPLRDYLGFQPGEVEVTADGAALRVEAVASDRVIERDGRLIIPKSGLPLTDETVLELRHADQR